MPRRSPISLAEVADLATLTTAFWQASRGKRLRADMQSFAEDLDGNLARLANAYLDGLDRFLLEALGVRAMVRYMDDVVWWCDTREDAQNTLAAARTFVTQERGLEIKADAVIGRSAQGLPFLGFRVLPGTLRLSLRRRRRYTAARARWERAFIRGAIDARTLQTGYASALGITAHSEATAWRTAEMASRLTIDV